MQISRPFILEKKHEETDDVTSLFLRTKTPEPFVFTAGQYVNISPIAGAHGKSYTISSAPGEGLIRITIKRKGKISAALMDLAIESEIALDGPYGYFFPEEEQDSLVYIAGGIGITPFVSMLNHAAKQGIPCNATLLYSNKTKADVVFREELEKLTTTDKSLSVVHFLTRSKETAVIPVEYKRIDAKLLKKHIGGSKNKWYYICGPIQFVTDIWNMLRGMNIPEDHIFTESFF
jgi:ferredoxin-NADP reductase